MERKAGFILCSGSVLDGGRVGYEVVAGLFVVGEVWKIGCFDGR